MTGYDIIEDARARLADNEDLSYVEADMLRFLNDAIRDFAQTGCIQGVTNIDSSAGTLTVFSDDRHIEVFRVDGPEGLLSFAALSDLSVRQTTELRVPLSWTLWGGVIYLDGQTPGTFTVWYSYTPLDMTGLQENINTQLNKYRHALTAYVEWRCRKQNDDPLANQAEAEYIQTTATAATIAKARFSGGTQ